MAEEIICFENSPASQAIEDSFKKCVVVHSNQDFPKERIESGLRSLAPTFPWRIAEVEDYRLLVEGPGWWRDRVIRQETVRIDGIGLRAVPWDASFENGLRLRSLWVRVIGFPRKLWSRDEFAKLIKGFGILLQIDPATMDRSDLKEAKLRIGVCKIESVPSSKPVVYRNDRNEYCWTPVRFVLDTPIEPRSKLLKRKRIWIPRDDQGKSVAGKKTTPSDPSSSNQHLNDTGDDVMGGEEEEEWEEKGDEVNYDQLETNHSNVETSKLSSEVLKEDVPVSQKQGGSITNGVIIENTHTKEGDGVNPLALVGFGSEKVPLISQKEVQSEEQKSDDVGYKERDYISTVDGKGVESERRGVVVSDKNKVLVPVTEVEAVQPLA